MVMPTQETTDEQLVETVEALYERNERDNGSGGVHPSHVASYLDVSESTAKRSLRRLCEGGSLECVQGIDPETGLSRRSYVPTAAGSRRSERSGSDSNP